ncbi:MAG: cytochrome c3 family protein [Bacillota bacterium]|nr:cytochrome c3 family protein [Bacillota bacterium]
MKRIIGLSFTMVLIFVFFNGQGFSEKELSPPLLKAKSKSISLRLESTTIQSLNSSNPSQQVHGSYQNNTNACAGCHDTHNSSSDQLLKTDGVYNTCVACHDGTMGNYYNVFSPSTAGTFSGSTGGNPSMHNSSGALTIKAAPGGIIGSQISDDEIKTKDGDWTAEFNCASCHSPHGSYSDRLLQYNPNNMGNTDMKKGGNKAVLVPVYTYSQDILTHKQSDSFILIRGTKEQLGVSDNKIQDSDTVIALYEWDKDKYNRSETPWLYGIDYGVQTTYWTALYKTETPDYTKNANGDYVNIIDFNDSDVHFQFDKGYVYTSGSQLNAAKRGDIAQAYVVKLDKVKIATEGDTSIYAISEAALYQGPVDPEGSAISDPSINKVRNSNGQLIAIGLGTAMSKFCSACHTDYLSHSSKEVGYFNTTDHRHSTDLDQLNCVRCHFAHGTDVTIMKDAQGYTLRDLMSVNNWDESTAKAYLLDTNPDSALKKFTDTAVCYACHGNLATQQVYNNPYAALDQEKNMPDLVPYSEQKTH